MSEECLAISTTEYCVLLLNPAEENQATTISADLHKLERRPLRLVFDIFLGWRDKLIPDVKCHALASAGAKSGHVLVPSFSATQATIESDEKFFQPTVRDVG
jgi:hypothetical protein